jgi:hypothetical protein
LEKHVFCFVSGGSLERPRNGIFKRDIEGLESWQHQGIISRADLAGWVCLLGAKRP